MDKLKNYNISLHGPYYHTEHPKKSGTMEYENSKEYFIRTIKLSKHLNGKYIVYHHNNCNVNTENKIQMISNSSANLLELNELAKVYGVNIVVENAGVLSNNNMLFNEEEFIMMGKNIDDFFEIYRKYTPKADLVLEYNKECKNDVDGIIRDVDEIKHLCS